jgi:undecaprenyl-diphosphatase
MLRQHSSRLRSLLPNIEPVVLVAMALATAALWGFINVADEVVEGDTHDFDRWVLVALRTSTDLHDPIGPRWVEEVARDISALGGLAFVAIATVGIAVYLFIDRKGRMALFLTVSTASGALVGIVLKAVFSRPRPDLVPHLSPTFSSSFPSGHSLTAAVVYLTLGALVASVVTNVWLKAYLLAVGVLITIAVGLTRIYLGVHYPTDVLAGWLADLLWALVCWLIARRLQILGKVEAPQTGLVR